MRTFLLSTIAILLMCAIFFAAFRVAWEQRATRMRCDTLQVFNETDEDSDIAYEIVQLDVILGQTYKLNEVCPYLLECTKEESESGTKIINLERDQMLWLDMLRRNSETIANEEEQGDYEAAARTKESFRNAYRAYIKNKEDIRLAFLERSPAKAILDIVKPIS